MTTVDEARAALLTAILHDRRAEIDAAIGAFEAAIRAESAELDSAYRIALRQIEHDGEVINRLTVALRVAAHAPHDQDGEPDEGFPVCSVCGAIQTGADAEAKLAALREAALPVLAIARRQMLKPSGEPYFPEPNGALYQGDKRAIETLRAALAATPAEEERT